MRCKLQRTRFAGMLGLERGGVGDGGELQVKGQPEAGGGEGGDVALRSAYASRQEGDGGALDEGMQRL